MAHSFAANDVLAADDYSMVLLFADCDGVVAMVAIAVVAVAVVDGDCCDCYDLAPVDIVTMIQQPGFLRNTQIQCLLSHIFFFVHIYFIHNFIMRL